MEEEEVFVGDNVRVWRGNFQVAVFDTRNAGKRGTKASWFILDAPGPKEKKEGIEAALDSIRIKEFQTKQFFEELKMFPDYSSMREYAEARGAVHDHDCRGVDI